MSNPPPLTKDSAGRVAPQSLGDLIAWFLDHDQRVNAMRRPEVEEIFQWKQAESQRAGEEVYPFENAEARLAIGIMQALIVHANERALHEWISQLLNALDDAAQTNAGIAEAYKLGAQTLPDSASPLAEAAKIPAAQGRTAYLTSCWLEALCTAEVRVLGWVYQELYGRPFHPESF